MLERLLTPLGRAFAQLDDRAFLGVLLQSVLLAALCFLLLHVLTFWLVHSFFELRGWLAWGADIIGTIGASFLALWLFIPIAVLIGTLYIERIARAVERRHYPYLRPAEGASLAIQAWDGLAVAARILALNVIALVLALVIPGVGLIGAWAIAAFAIGRGLFVAVAMRRMSRPMAEALYRRHRGVVLAQGGILALAGYIPALNLLIPVLGTAAMVHVLDRAMVDWPMEEARAEEARGRSF
jgi:CysZ protein